MKNKRKKKLSRREFIGASIKGSAVLVAGRGFPSMVPASVFGKNAPSNRINVGAIGTGRISRGHDLPGVWQYDIARVMAACDLDRQRLEDAKTPIKRDY